MKKSLVIFILSMIVLVLIFFFIGDNTIKSSSESKLNTETELNADSVNTYDFPLQITEEEILQKDLMLIKSEIETFDSISLNPFLTSVENIQLGIQYFEKVANDIQLAEQHADKEINKYGKTLKNKLVAKQKIWFPKYRKAYANIMADKVWENDVYISTSGSTNTIFNLTGGIFAANKNIKEMQETIHSILYSLRFKQSRYRWYKGADDYTYYTINSKQDSEI